MVTAPTTQLDERFSGPEAKATPWDDTRAALEGAQLFWITTVRHDGRPHVTPLVAVWRDNTLYFCTGADEQKGVNLTTNPHVILTTGCNQWDQGIDVVVEGDAVRVTDDALLERLADAWRTKWDHRWHYEVKAGAFQHDSSEALVYAVAPTKVLSFGKGNFSHTRHVFTT